MKATEMRAISEEAVVKFYKQASITLEEKIRRAALVGETYIDTTLVTSGLLPSHSLVSNFIKQLESNGFKVTKNSSDSSWSHAVYKISW
ncbi:hypothetical protein NCTGTJJY_CDS0199 [Serratia phage 92A1]|nr:hypothetical protein NCTGTJJY_CDS0199 [Serratia phage 92A1]